MVKPFLVKSKKIEGNIMTISEIVMRCIGALRIYINVIFKKRRIHISGIKQYMGKNAHLRISHKGMIDIGKALYLSERSSLGAHDNGVLKIGDNNYFSSNINVVCYLSIKIGDNNLFAQNVIILDHHHNYDSMETPICKQGFKYKPIEIGSDCWICANTVICPGTYIGNHIVVSANSVVKGRLEKPGVYAGSPAKLIKER